MKDFVDFLDNDISDELLAAYIDGNTTESEKQLIESSLNGDSMLSEAYEIASDSAYFENNMDWSIYNGDYGFLEMGLPPVIDMLDMVSVNQDYGLSFDNNDDLLGSDNYPMSNGISGYNDNIDNDDNLISFDMDDMNLY